MLNTTLRLIFPAWNFFDDVADPLFVTVKYANKSEKKWIRLEFKPENRDAFFYKPNENWYLYLNALLLKFSQQISELKDEKKVLNLESYAILTRYIRSKIVAEKILNENSDFVFRINFQNEFNECDYLFQSEEIKCKT